LTFFIYSSSAKVGYIEDKYAEIFAKQKRRNEPLHNLGTAYRVLCIRKMIEKFLNSTNYYDRDDDDDDGCNENSGQDENDSEQTNNNNSNSNAQFYAKQVVNLGSGYDTSFFCLNDHSNNTNNNANNIRNDTTVKWFDVDFAEVTRRKISIIEKHKEMFEDALGVYHYERDGSELRSMNGYSLLSADIRDCDELKEILLSARFDPLLPTLFITEVSLSYLPNSICERILSLIALGEDGFRLKNAAIVSYEAMRLNDEFGRRMCTNVREQRGTPFLSCEGSSVIDCESTEERLRKSGFDHQLCRKMTDQIHFSLTKEEIFRLERVEMLDEREEFDLIQSHYSFSVGVKGSYFKNVYM
jgi:O-methyltransferase involved in polyketide biosynthesis